MGKRKAYTPFSTSSEAGVTAAPVEGFIDVTQDVRPIIDTGFVDSKGRWIGHVTSDTEFKFYQKDEEIANGATFITAKGFNMTGFQDLTLAIRPTNGGNVAITACMGSDGTNRYANLTPLDNAATLKGSFQADGVASTTFGTLVQDNSESLTADVWNIFYIQGRLKNQKLLQFKITNNSGGNSTVETCFLRSV